jgi:hypothetical protein
MSPRIQVPLGSWQDKNWDPEVGSSGFDDFCDALGKPPFKFLSAEIDVPYGDDQRLITLPGGLSLDFVVLNYAKYIREVRA